MAESVYKVIELVGTSTRGWEQAAAAAIKKAGMTLRDLRIAEVVKLDMQIENGKIAAYRARVNVSFKYGEESDAPAPAAAAPAAPAAKKKRVAKKRGKKKRR